MSQNIDIVLINPASRAKVYQSLGRTLAAIENPVWAGLMAGYCRRKGLKTIIIDAEAEELSAIEVAERVHDIHPTLAVVVVYGHQPSASTQIMTCAGEVATAIKDKSSDQRVVMVGGHVAALPERTLIEEDVDFVCTGEGVQALVDLCTACKAVNPKWSDVPGICYYEGESIRRTKDTPLLRELDQTLPGTPWDLLPMDRYRAHNWHCLGKASRQPYAALYTTLGCPYRCSFCCIQAPFKDGEKAAGMAESANSYRFWSPQHVLSQIDCLVQNYGVQHLKIADEMFVLNRRHVEAICDGLIKRNYDLNIWAYTRVDTIKDGMLPKLRKAGVTWLALGIESGAESVRSAVDKSIDQDAIFSMVNKIRAEGIHTIGNYIFGLPNDTHESMQQTLELAWELKCEFANFYSAMAYPGSALYKQAIQYDVPLPLHWSGYSQHSYDCLPLPTKFLTSKEVLHFRDEAFDKHFKSSTYLDHVCKTFGKSAADDIRSMSQTRLSRGLLDGALTVPNRKLPIDTQELSQKVYEELRLRTS
jgi:radical SAM superfamily enzyme YgiQ (UPF0313 family)